MMGDPTRVTLGRGKVSVFATIDDGGKHILLLENNLGGGKVGSYVPGREFGTRVQEKDISSDAVILEFSTTDSVQVVIDELRRVQGYIRESSNQPNETSPISG
jgi:hypothetical protein